MEKHTQHEQARNLFFQTDLSNTQIAALLDLSRNTITRWIKQEQWREMKHAATQAPGAVLLELYDQLTALNKNISSREPHLRYPTPEEAIVQRRLMMSIKATERQHPGNYMQVYAELIDELKYEDIDLAKKIMSYSQNIVQRKVTKDTRFNTQQYMFLEDEIDETISQNTEQSTPPLYPDSDRDGEGQGVRSAPSCTIEKNDILCDNQPLHSFLPTSMSQQKKLHNAPHTETTEHQLNHQLEAQIREQVQITEQQLDDKIAAYKQLGYEKPTNNRAGLFFAQKKIKNITIRLGRIHPHRDPDMINYFDSLWGT